MSLILAALSSSVPIVPAAPSAAQSGAAQIGSTQQPLSGFAAVLAAVQSLSGTGATPDAVEESGGATIENGGAPGKIDLRFLATQVKQLQKKSGNSNSPAGNASSLLTAVIPASSATLPIAPDPAQTKALPFSLAASPSSNAAAVTAAQTNIPSAAPASDPNPRAVSSVVPASWQSQAVPSAAASGAALQNVLDAHSLIKQAPRSLSDLAGASSARAASSSTLSDSPPAAVAAVKGAFNQAGGLMNELRTSAANTVSSSPSPDVPKTSVARATPTNVPENQGDGSSTNNSASGSSNTQPALSPAITLPVTSAIAKQSATTVIPPNITAGAQEAAFPIANPAPAPPAPPLGNPQETESAVPTPTLLAKASVNIAAGQPPIRVANPQDGQQPSASRAANPRDDEQSSAPAEALDTGVQANLVAQAGVSDSAPGLNGPLPETSISNSSISIPSISNSIPNPLISNSSIPNSSAQVAAAESGRRPATVKETIAFPSGTVRSAASTAGAAASLPPAGPSNATGSGNEAIESNQNPFSVFFSSPGPGTESAASVLPKMILPGTSSAAHDPHTPSASASAAPTANSQTSAAPNGTSQAAAPQTPAPQNASDPAASPGGLQIAQAAQHAAAGATSAQAGQVPAAAQPSASATSLAAPPQPPQPAVGAATTPRSTAPFTSAQGSTAGAPAQTAEALPLAPMQMAQMVNRAEQSEMRIGMSTSAFGSVEVRTVVHANDVGLVIGSEKGDLRTLLGNELPAITNTLQQQNLRLNSVNFMQGFAFSNNTSGGGGNFQHRPFATMPAPAHSALNEPAGEDSQELPPAVFGSTASSLSILA